MERKPVTDAKSMSNFLERRIRMEEKDLAVVQEPVNWQPVLIGKLEAMDTSIEK